MSGREQGFPPVVDGQVRALVLGSFPGVASLGEGRYYAHPQNQFWRLMGDVIGGALWEMPYEKRLETLLAKRIGLWDVIGCCVRKGSLDSNIREAVANDFSVVLESAPLLELVCFNGKTAARQEAWFACLGFRTAVLPSSSPANTMSYPTKRLAWLEGFAGYDDRGAGTTGEAR